MKNHRLQQTVAAVAASCLLVSCGGIAGAQSASQARTTVQLAKGVTTSIRFNQGPSSSIGGALQGFSNRPTSFMLNNTLRDTQNSLLASACGFTTVPAYASKVDADGDGIAATLAWSFNYDSAACGSTGDTKYKFTGTFTEKDSDETKMYMVGGWESAWDYASTADIPASTSSGKTYPAFKYSYTGKGYYNAKQSGSSFVHLGDYKGALSWSSAGKTGEYTYTGTFNHTVTPTVLTSADAWKAGSATISGTWFYSGVVPAESSSSSSSSGGQTDILFTVTSKDLTYDSTCSKYWKTGSFLHDVGGGHVFEVRYGCTTETYYYDGKEYDPNTT